MNEIRQIGQHNGWLCTDIILCLQLAQSGRNVTLHDRLEQVNDAGTIGKAEHLTGRLGSDLPCPMGDGLIQQRQGITGRAFTCARDHLQGIIFDGDIFLLTQAAHIGRHLGGVDAAQIKALAAGENRNGHFANFGGRENEFHMFGRLLECFQQTIEGCCREHMHLIDDVDLVAGTDRLIARRFDDLSDIVDRGVGSGVHFHDVDMAAFHDGLTMAAHFLHIDGRGVDFTGDLIIERSSENTGGGRLAHTANPGQHIGLSDAARRESIGKGPDHRPLPDHVIKACRPIFARQHAIAFG